MRCSFPSALTKWDARHSCSKDTQFSSQKQGVDAFCRHIALLVHRTDHIKMRIYFLLSSTFRLIEHGIFKEKPLTCLLVHP